MKLIPLTQGYYATVDDWNFEWLNQFKWYAHKDSRSAHFYARRTVAGPNGQSWQYMHRVIMGDPAGMEVDHKDHDATLDNREENLRVATHSKNQQNRGPQKNNTSGFKGVTFSKPTGKYAGSIGFNKKYVHLGYFNTAVEAAAVYNWAAKRLHGECAYQNDLTQVTEAQTQIGGN
jgi:hypothetical protein